MRRSVLATLLASSLAAVLGGAHAQADPASQTVTYGGITLTVPSTWEVIDLDSAATACVRLDRDAIYLGTPPEQQDCPADAIGRGSTIWIGPTMDSERELRGGVPWSSGSVMGRLHRDASANEQTLLIGDRGASVRSAWGVDDSAVREALAGVVVSEKPEALPERHPAPQSRQRQAPREEPMPAGPKEHQAAVVPASLPAAVEAATASATTPLHGGMAFDTCSAPAVSTMQAWRQSPYVAVGIYTSGPLRACPFRGGSTWVNAVAAQGWGIIPIHVGRQAPCVQANLTTMSRDIATAKAQAVEEAGAAVQALQALGLGPGTPIFLDIENYAMNDPGCTAATMAFVGAWTRQLSAQGYLSGVYGGVGSLMRDMTNALNTGNPDFSAPNQIWLADWNQLQTTRDTYSPQYLSDGYWSVHQRMRQYAGGHVETWGGVSVNIDSNWADLAVAGNPVRTDYGANTIGPGSAGFVFTGSMAYWRGVDGAGAQGKAYWTGPSSSSTEYNGATWSPSLTPGIYGVEANVPDASSATVARYTLKDSTGTRTMTLDQAQAGGYRSLGTVEVRGGGAVSVHVADNGGGVAGRRIWADAIRFVQVGSVPSAPTNVAVVSGDGQTTVTWTSPASNGSPLMSHTVRANPGGASVTVAPGTTTAVISGLSNGTSYTFSVASTNAIGEGPPSAPSIAVTPSAIGAFSALPPVRVVDTRSGTTHNPNANVVVAPQARVKVRVAGGGTGVPTTASAVIANVTAIGGPLPGVFVVAGTGTSTVNWSAGETIANLSTLPVAADGTVAIDNASLGAAHLIIDVQGYVSASSPERWNAIASTRVLDTRYGVSLNSRSTALAPGETAEVKVVGGLVPAGATGAALRITGVGGTPAAVTVSPTGTTSTSVVNLSGAEPIGNTAFAKLSPAGTVKITNMSLGQTHVIVDVQAWSGATGSRWQAVQQTRVMDSRTGATPNPTALALGPGEVRTVRIAGSPGTPLPAGTPLVAVNVTTTQGDAGGWVGLSASGTPEIPLVNYHPVQSRAGFGWVEANPDGTVRVRNNSTGSVHVILDVSGYAVG